MYWPHKPSSAVYKTVFMQLTKAYVCDRNVLQSVLKYCYVHNCSQSNQIRSVLYYNSSIGEMHIIYVHVSINMLNECVACAKHACQQQNDHKYWKLTSPLHTCGTGGGVQ